MRRSRTALTGIAATIALVVMALGGVTVNAQAPPGRSHTTTPIQHLVVIFDENISFDHYFGTYPFAANPAGEPAFHARPGTPTINGLYNDVTASGPTGPLLTSNPNLSNPARLDRADPLTCDQDHDYTAEQQALDMGAADKYVQFTGTGANGSTSDTLTQCLNGFTVNGRPEPVPSGAGNNFAVMDYYDGNTTTALWNYAQQYAMSDNSWGTNFGPSTDGAINVTGANTYGAICGPAADTINSTPCTNPTGLDTAALESSNITAPAAQPAGTGTDTSDADPTYDICSYLPKTDGGDGRTAASTMTMGGPNIGDELTSAGLTWGWFEGGFDNGFVPGHGTAPTTAQICSESHQNVGGSPVVDYIPHHEPFQYYASTANPMHKPPTSVAAIGHNDQANHQYDLADFWAAADTNNMPAVSYLKAPGYQDGHAGYSDPLDEQNFLVNTINHLQRLPSWSSTAVVIAYDDSDGWYDHQIGPVVSQSQSTVDALTGTGTCGSNPAAVPMNSAHQPEEGRCGVGPRLPLLVVSPFARSNFVDNTFTDQSSVVKFIESNWGLSPLGNGAADTSAGTLANMFDFTHPSNEPLFLDPQTGEPASPGRGHGHH